MAEMLDCLVNYFSGDVNDEGMPRLYVCYHVVGGPGPIDTGGIATIMMLAASDSSACDSCQRLHAVRFGGPAAALEKALRYLDAFHRGNSLRKVESEVRCSACQEQPLGSGETASLQAAPRIEPFVLKIEAESGEPVIVLDARSPEAWSASQLRIPGDIRIDRDQFRIDPAWPKDLLIGVYCTCSHDAGAAEVTSRLREEGFTRAYVLHGGFDAWQAADGEVVSK